RRGERPEPQEYRHRFPDDPTTIESAFVARLTRLAGLPAGAGDHPERLGDYTLLRLLGPGGMGVVYRAFDQKRGVVVAIKPMQRADPAALLRFKQEFRALADISHPNLVTLHELTADRGCWFFTMELVEGVDFLTFVGSPADQPTPETVEDSGLPA